MIETILWIVGGLFVIGVIGKTLEEEGLKSWYDEKLKAREHYLIARGKDTMPIWREKRRPEKIAFKQRTKEEWEKYK